VSGPSPLSRIQMTSSECIICKDRLGAEFQIRVCGASDFSCLMDMYTIFSPRPASQGLPPANPEICRQWVKGLMEIGESLLAWRDDRVIGHAALIPDTKMEAAEFVIFVEQSYRNLGIGTGVTREILKRARELGFKSVWLTVALTNTIAMKLYKKLGFEYCDMDECERTMVLKL
jgi:GNAT superfamily N-acetyltransferase